MSAPREQGHGGDPAALRITDEHIAGPLNESRSIAFLEAERGEANAVAFIEIHEEGVSQTCSIYLDESSAREVRDWLTAALEASSEPRP